MIKKLIKNFFHKLRYGTAFNTGDVKYYIIGKGQIIVDMESLINSNNFKRQLAAVKRLSKGKKINYCGHGGMEL